VRQSPIADVLKVLLYGTCVVMLGSLMAPWVYNAGKGISETTEHKSTNGAIEWLADLAERTEFPGYYKLSLMIAAAVLLIPLFSRLGLGAGNRGIHGRSGLSPWHGRHDLAHGLIGLCVSALLGVAAGKILLEAGWLVWKPELIFWISLLKKAAISAILLAVLQEWIFRGWMLGIFLKAMRPAYAITLLSVPCVFIHLLILHAGVKVPDPEALDAGLVFLKKILIGWMDPGIILLSVSVILTACVILALARLRTRSLWLPTGLHAGWLLGFQMLTALTHTGKAMPMKHWLFGQDLRTGMIPWIWIAISGWIALKITPQTSSHEAA
jgi:uncharacterized protein